MAAAALPSSSALYFLFAFFVRLAFFFLFTSAFTATRLPLPFSISSSFSASNCLATFRFCVRERVAWHLMTMPVGRCFSCTADEVLFYGAQKPLVLDVRSWEAGKMWWSYNLLASGPASFEESFFEIRFIDGGAGWHRFGGRCGGGAEPSQGMVEEGLRGA